MVSGLDVVFIKPAEKSSIPLLCCATEARSFRTCPDRAALPSGLRRNGDDIQTHIPIDQMGLTLASQALALFFCQMVCSGRVVLQRERRFYGGSRPSFSRKIRCADRFDSRTWPVGIVEGQNNV
jgi:hypothetical protein